MENFTRNPKVVFSIKNHVTVVGTQIYFIMLQHSLCVPYGLIRRSLLGLF